MIRISEEERSLSVYSLSVGKWRELGKVSIKYRRNIFFNGVFFNSRVNLESDFILSFDMILEKLREIPEHDYGGIDDKLIGKSVGDFREYLSVADTYMEYLEIWVMKEYGVK